MADLIDKQSVLEIAMCYCPDDDGCCSKAGNDLREMLDEIEALPTVESQVRHGQWIEESPMNTTAHIAVSMRRLQRICGTVTAQNGVRNVARR